MAHDWTTTDLLASIKRKAFLPDAGGPFTDAELLAIADEKTLAVVIPRIEAVREEYYVATSDVAVAANTSEYRIPKRAASGVLRDVSWIDAAGNGGGPAFAPLGERDIYAGAVGATAAMPRFTIQGDYVVILPAPASASGTLRLRYYRRPSKLVATTAAARVTGISGAVYTCADVPTAMTTSTPLDLVCGQPTFAAIADDETPSGVATGASGTLTFASAITGAAIGDHFAQSGETPVPQIPESMRDGLADLVAAEVLLALGNAAGMQMRAALGEASIQKAAGAMTPRVHGKSPVTVNWNSPLRAGRRRFYR